MHEVSLILNLLDIVEENVRKFNAKRVTHIYLKVGKLSGAEPELLKSAFEVVKKGTVIEDATLTLEVIEPLVKCLNCGYEFSPEDMVFICPRCSSAETRILKGEELLLEKMEVEK